MLKLNQKQSEVIFNFLTERRNILNITQIDKEANSGKVLQRLLLGKHKTLTTISLKKIIPVLQKIGYEPLCVEYTFDNIQRTICRLAKIKLSDLRSKTSKREIVEARQIAMWFCKHFIKSNPPISSAMIGNAFGGFDHATVLHSIKTVNNLYENDKIFKLKFDQYKLKFPETNT